MRGSGGEWDKDAQGTRKRGAKRPQREGHKAQQDLSRHAKKKNGKNFFGDKSQASLLIRGTRLDRQRDRAQRQEERSLSCSSSPLHNSSPFPLPCQPRKTTPITGSVWS